MLLKKLISLINIICYFIVVPSVDTHTFNTGYLVDMYNKQVLQFGRNIFDKYFICSKDTQFRNMRIQLAATVCKYTMNELQVNAIKINNDELYIAYDNFDEKSESLCIKKHINVQGQKISQKMIYCYNIPPLINMNQTPQYTVTNAVYIYPTNDSFTSWLVIKCIIENNCEENCMLIAWLDNSNTWDLVPITLFDLPVPLFEQSERNIYVFLFGFMNKWDHIMNKYSTSGTHVLQKANSRTFGILCSKITGLYKRRSIPKPTLYESSLMVSIPKTNNQYVTLNGLFYSCDDIITINGFSLFVGPEDSIIILARRESGRQYHRILKNVYNIYAEFLSYLF